MNPARERPLDPLPSLKLKLGVVILAAVAVTVISSVRRSPSARASSHGVRGESRSTSRRQASAKPAPGVASASARSA